MKNQAQKIPLDTNESLFQTLEDKGIMEWISLHGKKVIYGISAFLILLAVIYQFSAKKTSNSEKDFLQAASEYQGVLNHQEGALARLEEILARRPELEAEWGAPLAQYLINSGNIAKALPYAERALKRTSQNGLNHFSDYSKTTLLIANNDLEGALKNALLLKESQLAELTKNEGAFNDTLFAYNLLRIASLEKALNHPAEEKQAYEEWKKYAGFRSSRPQVKTPDPAAYTKVASDFSAGTISLVNYIEEREKLLN